MPQVAQAPIIPLGSEKKTEIPSKKPIDNLEKSTYSVLNKRQTGLSAEESAILDLIDGTAQYPDAVMDRSELPASAVQSILTRLGIKGLVQYLPDGRIIKK